MSLTNFSNVTVTTSEYQLTTVFNVTYGNTSVPLAEVLFDEPILFRHDPVKYKLSQSLTALSVLILMEVMLGLGCSVEVTLLRGHLKKPIGIIVAGFTQFIVMPLLAFSLAKLANLNPVPALATLITASVPGGTLSNILAYLIKGDMSLSILMTTVSTILALAFIPLNLFLYGSHWLPAHTALGKMIPYSSIVLSFALMTVPTLCGVFIKWKWPHIAKKVTTVCKVLLLVTLTCLITISAYLYGTNLLENMSVKLWLIALFMPAIGFTLGFIFSTIGGLRGAARRTVGIETGCQNSHMAAAILKVAFPMEMIGSYFLFPLIYGGIQFIEGGLLVVITLLFLRFNPEPDALTEEENKVKTEQKTSSRGPLWQRLQRMQHMWLARQGSTDKRHILSETTLSSSKASKTFTTVAHDIADVAKDQ